jgi:hypothetical protein
MEVMSSNGRPMEEDEEGGGGFWLTVHALMREEMATACSLYYPRLVSNELRRTIQTSQNVWF